MGAEAADGWTSPELYDALRAWIEANYWPFARRASLSSIRRCHSTDFLGVFPLFDATTQTLNQLLDRYADDGVDPKPQELIRSFISVFAYRFLQVSPGGFQPEAFDALYAGLEQCLYRWQEIEFTATVDFWNVDLATVRAIEINGLTLRPITQQELDAREPSWSLLRASPYLVEEPAPSAVLVQRGILADRIDAEHKLSLLLGIDHLSWAIGPAAERMKLALRLTASGTLWLGERRAVIHNPLLESFSMRQSNDGAMWTRHYGEDLSAMFAGDTAPPFVVTPSIVDTLRIVWPLLNPENWKEKGPGHKKEGKKNVLLALQRFDRSFHYDNPTDRFADLWVGLEALIGIKEPEMSYKMAVRLALMLRSDGQSRQQVFDTMRASYGVRSTILHGGTLDLAVIAASWQITEDCLRELLVLAVKRGKRWSQDELSKLDKRLFAGDSVSHQAIDEVKP